MSQPTEARAFSTGYDDLVQEARKLLDRADDDAWRLAELTHEALDHCGRTLTEWDTDLCDHDDPEDADRARPWAALRLFKVDQPIGNVVHL